MTRKEFQAITQNQILYLDGATGTNLVRAGMPAGVCPEEWICGHREVMLRLQRRYVEAGTDILYAPTFTANRIKLAEYGLEGRMEALIQELVGISREAAEAGGDRKVYIAGDLTMTGELLKPMGSLELEELVDIYKEQILCLERAGVDLLAVETMMSLAETRAALIAAKEVCELPVMVTMTFEAGGRTLYGTDPRTAAIVAESLGACAVGVNCSTGPAHMKGLIADMAAVTRIPIVAKPNAGLPFLNEQGETCYDMDVPDFVGEMEELVEAGASVLGGCCGTDPEFIRRLCETFGRESKEVPRRPEGMRYLTSERMTVSFGLEDGFLIVGERINPTGKKLLQAQLREGSLEKALVFAEEQERCGARILDINMGMSGIDEKEMMLRAIDEVSGVTSLPLSLDSSYVEVLDAALRHYPGRALINSVSLEKDKFERLLPIAAKYGAMFILLPLSDRGLPENLEEKKEIIETIYERALSLGMCSEDIVVDGLVATVGANRRAALETLETIRYCKERGFATICGLSNISFGMPERSFVNTAFLNLAIQAGLTMAIANPSQELLVSCALATDLLLAKEGADIRYIEQAGRVREERERKEAELEEQYAAARNLAQTVLSGKAFGGKGPARTGSALSGASSGAGEGADHVSGASSGAGEGAGHGAGASSGARSAAGGGNGNAAVQTGGGRETTAGGEGAGAPEASALRTDLKNAVLKGNRNGIEQIVRRALDGGEEPQALLNEVLLPAINEVGDYFDRGKYFLPQLIAGAEAMKNAIQVLEPLLLQEKEGEDMPVVVIATVEGDIHDIGKNLVALMLKNYGFKVIDLGKDVPKERIVEAAKEHHAQIIALSALMTTTMQRMREVIALARRETPEAKVMIGGAVITQEYADEIGADGYSGDAAEAVRLANRLKS